MKPNPASESPTEGAAASSDARTSGAPATTKRPADASVLSYLKWSSAMIVVVVIVAIVATRILRWLELA